MPLLLLTIALILASPLRVAGQDTVDPELLTGIRQAQTGDFEGAIIRLDSVAKRLAVGHGRPKELARAYLYLSIAYLGLSQEQKAKAQFLEALKADERLELTPREFPPRVLQFFEETRKETEALRQSVAPPAVTPPPAIRDVEKKGGSKTLPLLLGIGAAATAGAGCGRRTCRVCRARADSHAYARC